MIMDMRREIRGYVKIDGDERTLLRLMNICGHKGIKTWSDEKHDKETLYIYCDETEKVREIARNCMFDIEITEQKSLRQKFMKNRRRLSVLLGIVLFAVYIYIESLYVWRIDISGCGNYTEEEVLNVIEKNYPCYGRRKKTIDTAVLQGTISDNLEEVCWVSCSISGTKLTVRLSESVDVFTDDTLDTPCDIVSSVNCTVYSIVTSMGTPVVSVGDEVKKGDTLILGTVNICNDESEIVDTRYVSAQGEIIGQYSMLYHDEVEARHYKKKVSDTFVGSISLRVGKKIMSVYDRKDGGRLEGQQEYDTESSEHWLHIGDFYLPFAIQISRNHVCNIEGREYSEDEMKALAEQHIATYIGELQEKGVQIVQKNVIITNRSDKLVADGNMIVRMSVGFPRTLRNVVSGNNIETEAD